MNIIAIVEWLKVNWTNIAATIAYIISAASIIVRLTPTLKDDDVLLKIIKFLSKYIALNTPTPTNRPQ